jgi:hypothetical protein
LALPILHSRVLSIKYKAISELQEAPLNNSVQMYPKCPSSRDYERIMTFLDDATHGVAGSAPPLIEACILTLKRVHSKASSLENNEPELLSKHSQDEELLNYFTLFIKEKTTFRMWEALLCQEVPGPTLIMSNQPDEETVFTGCPRLPYAFSITKLNSPLQQNTIC